MQKMEIGDWALNNQGGNWSDNWYSESGKKINCPQCGCSTVSPVPIDEYIAHKQDNFQGYNEHERNEYINDFYRGSLGSHPKDIHEIKDLNDNDELEAFHRKHGMFVCGNIPCNEQNYTFFSPHDDVYPYRPENKMVWDRNEKRDLGYNNPWDMSRGRLNKLKISDDGELW